MIGEEQLTEKEAEVAGRDPFPHLTFTRKRYWNFMDWWAYRRCLKLGIPNPWHAYSMGYERAIQDTRAHRQAQAESVRWGKIMRDQPQMEESKP